MSAQPFLLRSGINSSENAETLLPLTSQQNDELPPTPDETFKSRMVIICLIGLIVFGTFNRIFSKLQTIPMNNYPLTVNIYSCVIYVLFYFSYIIPTIRYGTAIKPSERAVPTKVFAVMGALDAISSIMQLFAFTYISSGALLVLLLQAAIPVSMAVSKVLLKTTYQSYHHVGALLVIGGLVVSLLPELEKHADGGANNQLVWAGVLIASCVPMALGAVYKEMALGQHDMNVMYLNGWVGLFQFLFSVLLSVPSIYAQPTLGIADLLSNLSNGVSCLFGRNSIMADVVNAAGKVIIPKDACATAPIFTNSYMALNIVYNVLIVNLLKVGGSNLLYLGITCTVPLVNIAFTLDFMPKHQDFTLYSVLGLVIILTGLVTYRFFGTISEACCHSSE